MCEECGFKDRTSQFRKVCPIFALCDVIGYRPTLRLTAKARNQA